MIASYTVIVRNFSQNANYFYVFQKVSSFNAAQGIQIISSSLGCGSVGNYNETGSQIEFSLDAQVYAGAVSTAQTGSGMRARTVLRSPVLSMSTTSAAIQPIALTAQLNDTTSLNLTTMSLNPLGLSRPTNGPGLGVGAFGIQVPSYLPLPSPALFCGNAVTLKSGIVVLSSFVPAPQNQLLSCSPQSIYFIKVGNKPEGLPVDYDPNPSTSAVCDFTTGYRTIIVQYNPDGTFSLVSST